MKSLIRRYWAVFCVVLLVCVYLTFFRTAEVQGISMIPTYQDHDFLLLCRTQEVKRGDIIAIYSQSLDEVLCKRVIGVAGDSVLIDNSGLYVNGTLQDESYLSNDAWPSYSIKVDLVVQNGQVFVLGDNRQVSNDSRALGCLDMSDLRGTVLCNVTKTFGVHRDALVGGIILLLIISAAYDVLSKLYKSK